MALLASWAVARHAQPPEVRLVAGIAVRDSGPREAPALLLLHGSPGRASDFAALAARLEARWRVVAPDLPGFGASPATAADLGVQAQAGRVLALLDALGIARAHLVGMSLGGGVAIELAARAPERVRSLVLLSSIGVQEFELLGAYPLNHLVHGLQLAGLRAADWLVPHFGLLDRLPLNVAYARSFHDTDQRRLRGILEAWPGPALVLHGAHDGLVPVEAAREHARIVPQSELALLDGGHRILWTRAQEVAERIEAFVARVEAGGGVTRSRAEPVRVAAAAEPFDAARAGPRGALAVGVFFALAFAASMVSEDLTCIGVGLLVGAGQVGFGFGTAACVFALWLGDLFLYAAGRLLGAGLLGRTGLAKRLARGAPATLERAGPLLILGSRFVPGSRLPTYLAAGALRYPLGAFAFWLLVAAAAWTPLLVGASAALGGIALAQVERLRMGALPIAIASAVVALALVRVVPRLATWRGRRLLLGAWQRRTRWEFWPSWALYAPVAPWIAWLALRHRSLRAVTAVNPAMPAGGLVGESKWEILRALQEASPDRVARAGFVPAGDDVAARLAAVHRFLADNALALPLVAKPDVGERGHEVAVLRSEEALRLHLAAHRGDLVVQAYVPGAELGVFYARRPGEARGRVLSITEKRMIEVEGDGASTLEELILRDDRAVCLAPVHLARHAGELSRVPAAGERVALVEIGTHSRGALFLDGARFATTALEAAIDTLSRAYPGFWFGRYDVRGDCFEAIARGDFRVVELNGLTAEATHMYDPRYGLLDAYRVIFPLWKLAFEVGAENVRRGARLPSWRELLALWRRRGR